MSTILVPLDFSECAPNVLAEAVRFARAFEARLLLLHASETPRGLPLTATVQPPGSSAPLTVEALLRRDAEARLAPLQRDAREAGVRADALIAFGPIAATILDVAAREQAAMILMGTHGRTGLAHLLLGSVAERVIRGASVPVVTVCVHAGEAEPTLEERVAEDELAG